MKQKTVTVEDIVDLLKKKKQAYKALADEYKDRYNNKKDSNKAICRNMYYQNIYMYNEAEDTLAEIEGRQPKMYCFTFPPFVDLPKILAEYEKFRWHDLRKNPNDLPKKDDRFCANISVAVMTQTNDLALYSFDAKKWYSKGKEIYVIAWCELHKFEEE